MTAPTYTEVEDRLLKMQDYIDRLYKTITFNGVTCGLLMSNPGFPVWADINPVRVGGVWVGNTDATDTKGVWYWNGSSWTEKDTDMTTAAKEGVRELAVCPHNPDIVLATTEDGVWRTTNAGGSWSELTMPDACDYGNIAWDTENPGKVIITGSDIGEVPSRDPRCARSTDYGANWSSIDLPVSAIWGHNPGPIAYHDGKAIIGLFAADIRLDGLYWYSSDNGSSWTKSAIPDFDDVHTMRFAAKLTPNEGSGNFIATMAGVTGGGGNKTQATTSNGGSSWSTLSTATPAAVSVEWGQQLIYDTVHSRLWGCSSGGDLYYSDNWGNSWTTVTFDSGTSNVHSIAVDQNTGYLYIAKQNSNPTSYQGVFVSIDSGSNWSKLGDREFVGSGIGSAYAGNPAGRFSQKRVALGQYFSSSAEVPLQPHSVVSGQSNKPSWIDDGTYGGTSDDFDMGLDAGRNLDYKYVPAQAERQYSTVNSETKYKLYYSRVETDPGPPPVYDPIEFSIDAGDTVDVYIGPTRVVEKLETKNDQSWTSDEIIKQNNTLLTSLNYPPRHAFHLGKLFYYARNDTTKAGYFDNSISQTGFAKDIYEVLHDDWVYAYDHNYIFSRAAYPDVNTDWGAADQISSLPVGLASDGQYVYPHQSKVTAKVGPISIADWFIELTKYTVYNRMLWAMQMLRHGDVDTEWPDPALAAYLGGLSPVKTSAISIAEEAIALWDDNRYSYVHSGVLTNGSATVTGLTDTSMLMVGTVVTGTSIPASTTIASIPTSNSITLSQNATDTGTYDLTFKVGLGMPPATGEIALGTWRPLFEAGKAASFATGVFLAFMSWMGYGACITRYKAYADDAARCLCNAIWGMSPNNTEKAYIDGSEYTRPNHVGGVLVAWKAPQTAGTANVQVLPKTDLEKHIDSYVYYDFRVPLNNPYGDGQPVLTPSSYFQKLEEPVPSPTNMEGTALCWIAMRMYNAYKHSRAYPSGTWSCGLDMGGAAYGFVGGQVLAGGSPAGGATVILVDGTQTANPQDLTAYMETVQTDANGAWTMQFEATGNKTIYVVKSGYKHVYKTYNFAQLDQNIVFPDAALVSV